MDLSKTVSNIPYVNDLLSQILLLTKFVDGDEEATRKWLLETDFRTFSIDDVYEQYINKIVDKSGKTRHDIHDYIECICNDEYKRPGERQYNHLKSILITHLEESYDDFWHIYYMDSKESTYRYIPNVSHKIIHLRYWYKYKYYDEVITNLKKALNTVRYYNEVVSEFKEYHPKSIHLHQLVESWSAEI